MSNTDERPEQHRARAETALAAEIVGLIVMVSELRSALQEIADTPVPSSTWSVVAVHEGMVATARAALAGKA